MSRVRVAVRILWAALQEIFDEAAYSRFLQRAGTPSSAESYAAFCRERECKSARRPRCC
jgi:hypothetical protein